MCDETWAESFAQAARAAAEFERQMSEFDFTHIAEILSGASKATPIPVEEFEAADDDA